MIGQGVSRWFVGLFCALAAGGCSIHPATDDVTPYKVSDIVAKTRCEARQALIEDLIKYLERQEKDPGALKEAARLSEGGVPTRENLKALLPITRAPIELLSESGIGYDFTLDMTETNSGSASLGATRTFTDGTGSRTFGLSGGLDLTRQTNNTFLITDTFSELLYQIDPLYCEPENLLTKEYLYPMTGNIGIKKTINTFIDLALLNSLGSKEAKKSPATMLDTFRFTTTWSGGASAGLEFLSGVLTTSNLKRTLTAGFASNSKRADMHQVIIGLSLPLPEDKTKARTTEVLVGRLVDVRPGATAAELRAANAIGQYILRFEIGRRDQPIIVQPLITLF